MVLSLTGTGETRVGVSDGSTKYLYIENTGRNKITIKEGVIKHFVNNVQQGNDISYDNTVSTLKILLMQTNTARAMKFRELYLYII